MVVAVYTKEEAAALQATGRPIPIGVRVEGSSKVDPAKVDPRFRDAVTALLAAGVDEAVATDDEIIQFLEEQTRLEAEEKLRREQDQAAFEREQALSRQQAQEILRLDQEAFSKAQAELDVLFQQERESIAKQAAEYAAMQKSVQEQVEAAKAQAEQQQRMLAEERAQAQAEAAAVAERGRKEIEGMQREGAEREVARRRVARSTVARPLLGGLAEEESGPQKLGYGGAFGGGGRLAGAQTLGVG